MLTHGLRYLPVAELPETMKSVQQISECHGSIAGLGFIKGRRAVASAQLSLQRTAHS